MLGTAVLLSMFTYAKQVRTQEKTILNGNEDRIDTR